MANQTYISFMDLFIKVYFYDCLSMRFLWWPYNRKPADPFDPGQIKHDNLCRGLTRRQQWKYVYTFTWYFAAAAAMLYQRLLSKYWKYSSTRYYCRWRQNGLAQSDWIHFYLGSFYERTLSSRMVFLQTTPCVDFYTLINTYFNF